MSILSCVRLVRFVLYCCQVMAQWTVSVPTDLGSINVTKSIEKYPTIPRSLQASDTASVAVHNTDGSTDVWGTEKPQHLKGEVAWICGEYVHMISDMWSVKRTAGAFHSTKTSAWVQGKFQCWMEHPEERTTSRGSSKYSEISYGYICNGSLLYQYFQWNASHFGNSTAFPETFPGKKMKLSYRKF